MIICCYLLSTTIHQQHSNISNGISEILPCGSSGEASDDDDISLDHADISPTQTKRTRLVSDQQDELSMLKLKYKQLFARSENFCMTAAHWKHATIISQVPATEATRDNMINQLMNNIAHSEDIFISLNWKHFTSCNKFQCHLHDSMWYDKHKIFVLPHNFFLEKPKHIFIKRCTHLQRFCVQWT